MLRRLALGGKARRRSPRQRKQRGFNLIVLTMGITVMNIAVTVALPLWSGQIQREREAELIFRGMQYAEAIRVFQQRQGRLPVRMQELMEVEPRAIRQLWPNPMHEEGTWGVIFQTGHQGTPGTGVDPNNNNNDPGNTQNPDPTGTGPTAGTGGTQLQIATFTPGQENDITSGQVTSGPIWGVYSTEGDTAFKVFFGQSETSQWRFTPDLLQPAPRAAGDLSLPTLPVNAGMIGRSFPPDVTLPNPAAAVPGGGQGGNVPGTGTPGRPPPGGGPGGGAPGGGAPGEGSRGQG